MIRTASRLSPSLALVLAALWLLLNQSVSLGHIALGLALGFGFAAFASRLRPLHARLRRVDIALLLVLVVLKDIVLSNLSVARVVLGRRSGAELNTTFIRIPIDLRDPHGLAALAAIVTATPGTVWSGLSDTGDSLALHVLDLKSESETIAIIKDRYERPLMRIFE